MRALDPIPATCYPALLILDADQQRAQATARLFTLADYQPIVVTSPYQAWQRLLRERFVPHALLVGRVETHDAPLLSRLIRRIETYRGQNLPIIPLPNNVAHEIPLLIQQTAHTPVTTGIVAVTGSSTIATSMSLVGHIALPPCAMYGLPH